MGESQKCYVEWKKPDPRVNTVVISLIQNSKSGKTNVA